MTAPSAFPRELTTCYSQVVVPVDFSPRSWRALIQAGRLARAFGVPRTVVHVDTSSPWVDEGTHELLLRKSPSGVPVEVTVVAARTPVDGIMRILGDDEGSLLVMSTHGHTAFAEVGTGSTAEALLRQWRGPMLLAGPHYKVAPVPFRRIVFCVDPASSAVSTLLRDDVIAWAEAFNVPIEVLAVVEPTPLVDLDAILRQNAQLEATAAALSTDERVAKLVRLEGKHPGRDIARYADAVEGTLVAIPTHARTPSARFVLGSTAMGVLRHVTSPVLVRRFPTR
jgi:nucleotide-binding universal stress UspA family protein